MADTEMPRSGTCRRPVDMTVRPHEHRVRRAGWEGSCRDSGCVDRDAGMNLLGQLRGAS
jgi:hypothetical protein